MMGRVNKSKLTILIIDNKLPDIITLQKLIGNSDRTILSAMEASLGLRLAKTKKVDLIIIDVGMPEMDGFEIARTLKSQKKTRTIPIIFSSIEKVEWKLTPKGSEEGAFDYLQKPLDPEVTRARVNALLKIQSQKKELVERNTSLKKAEELIGKLNLELHRNLAQLEIVNKDLESFTYSVSHDLLEPIQSVLGFLKILEASFSESLGSNGGKLLNTIIRNVKLMNILIHNQLGLSRLSAQELNKKEIDSEEMVRNIVDELKIIKPEKTTIEIEHLNNVVADPVLIKQVWVNLISNAIKYSSKNNKPQIRITTESNNGKLIFSVEDNGIGFNMLDADKLFKVFQRLHENEFEGAGVGLSLVKRIIDKHGGKVWAEAKVNEGATFYFSLPNVI